MSEAAKAINGFLITDGVLGPWLVVFPASGHVAGVFGKLIVLNVGGHGAQPFIGDGNDEPTAIDPRATIVHAKSLEPAWEPRRCLDKLPTEARRWFLRNPDVFQPGVETVVKPLGK